MANGLGIIIAHLLQQIMCNLSKLCTSAVARCNGLHVLWNQRCCTTPWLS